MRNKTDDHRSRKWRTNSGMAANTSMKLQNKTNYIATGSCRTSHAHRIISHFAPKTSEAVVAPTAAM